MNAQLTLYYRQGCHLCDDMAAHLSRLRGELAFDVGLVDIDGDIRLRQQYNEQVPVLMRGDQVLSRYFLDEASLRSVLS
jgi:hypothetical protein